MTDIDTEISKWKALAFDLVIQRDQINTRLGQILAEIRKLQEKKEKEKEKNKK